MPPLGVETPGPTRVTGGDLQAPVAILNLPGEEDARSLSAELARRLGLPLCGPGDVSPEHLVLVAGARGLELWAGSERRAGYARVDWSIRGEVRGGGRPLAGQPLPRAIGRKPGFVVDATAGFGGDAFALATLGHRVLALERSPVMAALLEDGRTRALADPQLQEAAGRIQICCADAREHLGQLDTPPDAIYIDPMYPAPPRTKAALPRIEIQLLRRLVGTDSSDTELLAAALASGARRVVVKRPPGAPVLPGPRTDSHSGKLVRYDVYHAAPSNPPRSDLSRE
jgi:16S rRNA (guanine1516-N2)-methyltransferase